MAEIINIASFDINLDQVEKSLEEYQTLLFDIQKEQKRYADQSKTLSDQHKELIKQTTALEKSNETSGKRYADLQKQIKGVENQQEGLFKSQKDLQIQQSTVTATYNSTVKSLKLLTTETGEYITGQEALTNALSKEINTRGQAKKSNQELNKLKDELNVNNKEEAALLDLLNAKVNSNNALLKASGSQYEKQVSNVGNYTESILDALKAMEAEKKQLEGVKQELLAVIDATDKGTEEYKVYMQQVNVLNVQINNLSQSMDEATGSAGDLDAGTKLLNGGLGGFIQQAGQAGGAGNLLTGAFTAIRVGILGALQAGLAFIATPIGAVIAALAVAVGLVVGAFKLAKASLTSTEEGTQKLAVVTGAITGIFQGLFKIIRPLGEFLANVFIETLTNVGKAAEYALGLVADGLEFLGFDDTAKGVRDFTTEVKQSAVAAAKLADSENKLANSYRNSEERINKLTTIAEKLRQQRDDESKTINQRIKSNSELGGILKLQADYEKSLANQALANANLKITAEGGVKKASTESLNAQAEASKKLSEISDRIATQESEQLANLNSLRKESAAKQKELNDKAIESALKLSKARIDSFIAEQGFAKKSAEEQYKYNYDLYNKEYTDLKLQLNKRKITQAEFDAEATKLRTDYLANNADLLIENAALELSIETDKNARILDSDKFLSAQQYKLKQQALADQLAADEAFQQTRLTNGEINQQEYNAAINQIDADNRASNAELALERETADRDKKTLDLENQRILNADNFIAQAEIDKQENELKRQAEVAEADKTGADISLINAKYAKQAEDIEKAKQANKVQLAADAFGNLASIFGEESKAGKALAIAQATIQTYQSAVSSYSSLSGIPIIGPVLGGIAAAAAVATGLGNVKKIIGTKEPAIKKTPSYASGVIGLRGLGSGTSDSISANLSAGETVINARSTSMFANELSAINQAGGGVGLNGSSNILNQNQIQNNVNNTQMAQMIAEAVAIGAEAGTAKGSQNGISQLSADRAIMNDAKF